MVPSAKSLWDFFIGCIIAENIIIFPYAKLNLIFVLTIQT